ncbi:MAG: hypothetical protein ABII12_03560 [Planctomycetota bacterium]
MMHKRRRWMITEAKTPEQLARDLTEQTWTLCTGFEFKGYLFLNDSTSEDGAQEYAVVLPLPDGAYVQIESITFGWCSFEKGLANVKHIITGAADRSEFRHAVAPRLDTPEAHGPCQLCA